MAKGSRRLLSKKRIDAHAAINRVSSDAAKTPRLERIWEKFCKFSAVELENPAVISRPDSFVLQDEGKIRSKRLRDSHQGCRHKGGANVETTAQAPSRPAGPGRRLSRGGS